jgi:CheY-like chemotaxis protein
VAPDSVLKRILIADDSGIIRTLVRTSLEGQSRFEICEAADGIEAIEKARTLKPDLILLDLVMPRMNGAEATSILKGMMPSVPIILFTMYDYTLGKSLASAIGADVVLSKPDGINKLVECVQNFLEPSPPTSQSGGLPPNPKNLEASDRKAPTR